MIDRLTFRHAIAARMGQILTPEVCAAIEVAASYPMDRSIDPAQFRAQVVETAGRAYVLQVERLAAVLSELHPLHEAHWHETEAHRHGLELRPDYEAMVTDERLGRLLQFTVRHDARLVGNLRLYVMTSRHTGTLTASEDTLYVAPAHRGGLLGVKLVRYAIGCLRQLGVREFDADSKLVNGADVLMRRVGCTPVATKFHMFLE